MFCVGLIDSIAAATSADELKMPWLLLLFHYSKLLKMQMKMHIKKNKEIH